MAFVALWRQLRAAHRGESTLGARLRALPRMTVASLRRRQRYDGLWRLVLMGLALLYVVWPLDLVPVILLGPVGLIDDAVVITWLAGAVLSETGRFLEWEQRQAAPIAGEVTNGGSDAGVSPGPVQDG
jgi:uncharacterized membrane protein YkvA (DUF1232 family)